MASMIQVLLSSASTFIRATTALDYTTAGVLSPVAAGVLCNGCDPISGLPAGFYIGGAVTNVLANPLGLYTSPPTFPSTTAPSGWHALPTVTGLTIAVLGVYSANGYSGPLIRINGSVSSTGGGAIEVTGTRPAAAAGQVWTQMLHCALMPVSALGAYGITSSSLAGLSFTLTGREWGGTTTPQTNLTAVPTTAPIGSPANTFRLSQTIGVSTTTAFGASFNFTAAPSTAIDCTIWLAGWTLAQAQLLGLPVLPPGTQASQARAADAWGLSASQWSAGGMGSLYGGWRGDITVTQPAGVSTPRVIAQVSDGTDNNKLLVQIPAGGYGVQALLYSGGAVVSTLTSTQTLQPGTLAGVAMRWSQTNGTIGLSVNGESPVNATGLTVPTFSTAQFGNNVSLSAPLEDRIVRCSLLANYPNDPDFAGKYSKPGAILFSSPTQ